LEALRADLNSVKDARQKFKAQNQKLRQQTGIMNSKYLSKDFEDLKYTLRQERQELDYNVLKHKYMLSVIDEYNKRTSQKSKIK